MSQRIYGEVSDATALYKLIEDLLTTYQQNMEAAGTVASGELRDAASYSANSFVLNWKGETLMLSLLLPEHWWYVEHGRSPNNGQSGKSWPDPVGDIMQWMEVKHVVPRVNREVKHRASTRVPDPRRQAAKAIVHKIFTRGFYTSGDRDKGPKGKLPLEKAIESVDLVERFKSVLTDQFNREVHVALVDGLVAKNRKS